ncbi:MAG TPA: hypothetical protein VFM18_06855 [Methanosarcina sp.]|nr:hypothetical protein [Methanosarcina sp.]
MTQAMFFQRRPDVVQAIQVTKDNHDAVRAFIKTARHIPYDLDLMVERTTWLIRDSDGDILVVSDDHMRKCYIQQNETL